MENKALNNLLFLQDKEDFLSNRYKIVNNEFQSVGKTDNQFEKVYSFSELEYPVYFTFHQLMNHVHNSYESSLNGYNRLELIEMFERAIDNLVEYYSNVDEVNPSFQELLEDLDEKVYFIHIYYRYGLCYWLPTAIKSQMNYLCSRLISTSEDVLDAVDQASKKYNVVMYGTDYSEDESDDATESEESDDSDESEDDSEEQSDTDSKKEN